MNLKKRISVSVSTPLALAIGLVGALPTTPAGAAFNMMERNRRNRVQPSPGPSVSPSVSPTAVAAAPNPNCTLIVPDKPLTAQGLATPYQLVATNPANGPCSEANFGQAAFVQAAIFDPATGQVSVYEPLVINEGDTAAAAPIVPTLPNKAVVALWFGFNGTFLALQGTRNNTLAQADCVTGLNGDLFGQVSACNAAAFFQGAYAAIQAGSLKVSPLGTGLDGLTCPSVRSFTHVDQDQSDNVTTSYLVTAGGQLAQNNAANAAALQGATTLINGSDNKLLVAVDTAIGCTPFMAPDLSNPGEMGTANPLNELSAQVNQQAPIALVPLGDPMALIGGEPDPANGTESMEKMNLYRTTVGQPADVNSSTMQYCQEILAESPNRIMLDSQFTMQAPPLVPGTANSLFTFLAARLNVTVGPAANGGLGPKGCTELLGTAEPFTLTVDGNGIVTNATLPTGTPPPSATPTQTATPPPVQAPPASPTPSVSAPAFPTPSASPTLVPTTMASASPTAATTTSWFVSQLMAWVQKLLALFTSKGL